MSRISVIVPVFNRERMVREALGSVAAQTRRPDEILLIDDGSGDNSGDAAKMFSGVTLIRQENRGVGAARNRGIENATGDYIAFLDSDDLWEREKLEHQEHFMNTHPEIPLCHTDEAWYRNGRFVNQKRYHRKEGGFIFVRSLERCLISPSAVMIRRDLFPVVGLFDETFTVCEDYDLWLRITADHPVGFVDEPLTVKRGGHGDQLSRKLDTMDRFRIRAIEKQLNRGRLCRAYREAAVSVFHKKADIIAGGYRKRGKEREYVELMERIKKIKN